jgi:hypothetical protein
MADNDIRYSRIPAKASERWELVRDICAGGDCEALGKYLPTLNSMDTSAENAARNKAYKERAVLYNATGRTRDGLLGLAFRKVPQGEESWPAQLAYLSDDCDGAGISIYQQSQSAVCDVLETGRDGLYVDYSEALKRPIIKKYKAEDIINWRESIVDGKVVRTLVVLAEEAEIQDRYATVFVPQWRELFLENGVFNVRVWQQPEKDKDPIIVKEITPRSIKAVLDYIPFEFIGAQNNDSSVDEAPLYDIAYINRAHYRNSADYEDSVFLVGQPQSWISGLDETWRDHLEKQGTAYLGSRAMLPLPVGGAFGIAQAQPNSMAKEAMDQKEAQMVALGARLIETTKAYRTATESTNDKEASTSVLATCVSNVSEAYSRAIQSCARYLDIQLPEGAEYEINQDFVTITADAQMITALVSAWQSGAYAKTDLLAWLRKLGVIDPGRSDGEIEGDLQSEGPSLGMDQPTTGAPIAGAAVMPDSTPQQTPQPSGNSGQLPQPVVNADKAPATPAPDLTPLIDSISALVAQLSKDKGDPPPEVNPQITVAPNDFGPLIDALGKMTGQPVTLDLAPLIAAINAKEETTVMEMDCQPIADAVAGAIAKIPAPIVNLPPPPPAPVVNMPPEPPKPPRQIKFTYDSDGYVNGGSLT